MILLAHHVELQHVPVLTVFFAVGIWLGWRIASFALNYGRPPSARPLSEGEGQLPPH